MLRRYSKIVLVLGILAQSSTGQDNRDNIEAKTGVKFPISEVEQLKLEVLKAKKAEVEALVRASQAELKLRMMELEVEVSNYQSKVLVDHHNPKNVRLTNKLDWVIDNAISK